MIEGLEGIRLTSAEETKEYGKFVFEPLQHGYGVTMGNALRRVLLSSIRGCAPVAIRVNGALHEFTTLPGLKEDLQEIIFNVRNLQVSIVDGDEATLSLKRQGRCVVTADDFEKNSLVKILNPGLKIAELSADDSVLDLQVVLRAGLGYVSNEENHELLGGTVDTIAIDSIFSPVRTANFTVEPVRIKQKADSERLILEITHFPTIKARDALMEALEIIRGHAQQLDACLKMQSGHGLEPSAESSENVVPSMTLDTVDGLKSRWVKVLKAAGIETAADYLKHRKESIGDFGDAGRKSVDEALHDIGIDIPEED